MTKSVKLPITVLGNIDTVGGDLLFYTYGTPSGPNTSDKANGMVNLQFLMDEASGSIVDEVAAVTLPVVGTPTYEQQTTGLWLLIGPGIACDDTNGFIKTSTTAQAALGTDDCVIEWIASTTSSDTVNYVYSTMLNTATRGIFVWQNFSTNALTLRITNNSDAFTQVSFTITATYKDGNPHKFRLRIDRSGFATLFVDGDVQGAGNVSARNGDSIAGNQCAIGIAHNSINGFSGILYEFRKTVGTLDANSGGPGSNFWTDPDYGAPFGSGGTQGTGTIEAQYVFNETSGSILDKSANNFDLTNVVGTVSYNNSISYPSGISPAIGTASGNVWEQDTSHLVIGANVDFSIEFWCKATSISGNQVIFETDSSNAIGSFQWYFSNATTLRPYTRRDSGTAFNPVITVRDITDGAWHHFSLQFDRDATMTIKQNGIPLTYTGSDISSWAGEAISNNPTAKKLSIGGRAAGSLRFNGFIAEFRWIIGGLGSSYPV